MTDKHNYDSSKDLDDSSDRFLYVKGWTPGNTETSFIALLDGPVETLCNPIIDGTRVRPMTVANNRIVFRKETGLKCTFDNALIDWIQLRS